jgi:hypothetical protein
MTMAESGALDEVTAIFSLLAALEGWSPPSSSKTFSLSGSMTGDGLPVAVELGQDDILITLVFCSSSSDCPTGYSCAGICYAAACPSAHPVRAVPAPDASAPPAARPSTAGSHAPASTLRVQFRYGLLCYNACPTGYEMLVAGMCYQSCPSGYTDSGLDCLGCPSGYYR